MISPHAVGVELGRALSDAEMAQVQQWIDDAYGIIAERNPDADPAKADRAVRTVVARYVLVPKGGETMQEVGIDDGRMMKRYSASLGMLTLADLLEPFWPELDPGTSTGQAFTITPSYTP